MTIVLVAAGWPPAAWATTGHDDHGHPAGGLDRAGTAAHAAPALEFRRRGRAVQVTLGSSSVSTDVVAVTLTSGGVSVSDTAPATQGAGTVAFTGIDGHQGDGRPGAPTATYVDRTGSQTDRITGSSESGARITATRTVPSAAGPYTATAASNGTYTVTVAAVAGSPASPITVTYLVTATDAAGNVGAVTALTYSVTR